MASPPTTSFGDLLRGYRLAAGLSQEQLADRAGLSERGISDLERGLKVGPHKETLLLLTNALALPPAERTLLESVVRRHRPGNRARRSRSVSAPSPEPPIRPSNLPIQLTSFIGREAELRAVKARLAETRLLTLTGAGGCGKTRLALRVAESIVDRFADGLWLVELALLADPRLVPAAVAAAFGLREQAQRPVVETLLDSLCPRDALVILDNCEHLADACADLAGALLRACPRLTVLATSRQPLRVSGEVQWPVPPLATPEPPRELVDEVELLARLPRYDAVRLFVERARAVRPGFTLTVENAGAVAGICRRLDGLPLAIELAASRLLALSPQAMLDRLANSLPLLTGGARDVPARQQTLRNTIAWSYELLRPDEQILFRRLAVFRGCTVDAVEAVCVAGASRPGSTTIAVVALQVDPFEGIASLVEKSLLRQEEISDGQSRYVMLETVREFAQEQLVASGEADAIERRHVLQYLELAETAEREVVGPREEIWHSRIAREHDNLRSAFDFCVRRGYVEPGFRLALGLWWFWMLRGHISEGRERFGVLFDRFTLRGGTGRRAGDRAKALHAAGTFASIQGDFPAARALQEEGLAISRTLGDLQGISSGLEGLVVIAVMQGDYAAARGYAEECLAVARALEDPEMIGHALNASAHVFDEQGDYAAARKLAEESVRVLREAGSPRQVAASQLTLGVVLKNLGDYANARLSTEDALAFLRRYSDRRGEALALANLGSLAAVESDFKRARDRLAESLAIQRDRADTAGVAFVLERFATLAVVQSQHTRAVTLAGAAAACRDLVSSPLPPGSQAKLNDDFTSTRQALGEVGVVERWAVGYAMTMDEAIAFALSHGEPGK